MSGYDDDLKRFAKCGTPSLPEDTQRGFVVHDAVRIWYATTGSGPFVILLHGGLGHAGNWGHQIPALRAAGYRVVVIDSRGHGRSSRDARPYRYEAMASDVVAVMDALRIDRAAMIGWSDGAVIALILGMTLPARTAGVLFFACNVDPSGVKPFDESNPVVERCLARHRSDYAELSPTPGEFDAFAAAVGAMMQTQPNFSAQMLSQIQTPVTIVQAEHDEFIEATHASYLARVIPNARLVELAGVGHFAPLQRPALFNTAVLEFLSNLVL